MGFERESFDKLMKVVWGKKSQMQQAMSRDSKGEPFIIRELEFKGAQTPSQLATALKVTSGRISTLLAALEKKGLIEREVDPNDRRIVHVNLTEQGRAKAPSSSARICATPSAGSFRRWGSVARANSWILPRNLPHT